jgi:hypothetical protein
MSAQSKMGRALQALLLAHSKFRACEGDKSSLWGAGRWAELLWCAQAIEAHYRAEERAPHNHVRNNVTMSQRRLRSASARLQSHRQPHRHSVRQTVHPAQLTNTPRPN